MKIVFLLIATFLTRVAFAQDALEPLNAVQDGVFFLHNMFSTTILELKGAKFRYWFKSDIEVYSRSLYPFTGDFQRDGGTVILLHKQIYETNWTFLTYKEQATLWRPAALKYWSERKRPDGYGVLYPTADKPEEMWTRVISGKWKFQLPK
jgi:hypothetical protein